jgi:hypothetical protein
MLELRTVAAANSRPLALADALRHARQCGSAQEQEMHGRGEDEYDVPQEGETQPDAPLAASRCTRSTASVSPDGVE